MSHIPALDGLRGLAILLVLLHHFWNSPQANGLIERAMFYIGGRGWIGVDLFFVLSGFLITGILLRDRGQPRQLRNFWVRRALRVFPAYYVALALFYVLAPNLGPPALTAFVQPSAADQVWFWTYLGNLRIAWLGDWYPHLLPNLFWSLAIEEQFYLLWPILIVSVATRTAARTCLWLMALGLALKAGMTHAGANHVTTFVFTPTRWTGLCAGSFVACLLHATTTGNRSNPGDRCALVLLIVGATAFVVTTLWRPGATSADVWLGLDTTLISVALAAWLHRLMTLSPQRLAGHWLSRPILRFLGKYSYGLYLWHGAVEYGIRQFFDPAAHLWFGSRVPVYLAHAGLGLAFSITAAVVSWYVIERPCLALKRYFA